MKELFPDCPDKRGRTSGVCKDRICLQECEEDAHYDPTDSCFEECRLCKDELADHKSNSCRPECRHCQDELIFKGDNEALKFIEDGLNKAHGSKIWKFTK